MPELIPITLYDDFESGGASFVLPAQAWGVTVRLPREQVERWQQVHDAWEDVQSEIRQLYLSARTEQTVGRSSDDRRCYVSRAGVMVHVTPGCRCGSFGYWPWR